MTIRRGTQRYLYRGDRWTARWLRGRACYAVLNERGKCIRGRNGNMLVQVGFAKNLITGELLYGELAVVQARQLRKWNIE